jgi:tRNA (guanine37-N1)-methyltransferase
VGFCGALVTPGLVEITAHDLRQWTTDKHHVVDDRPFGGGDGMVLKPEPIFTAVEALTGASRREDFPAKTRVMLLSPQGQVFSQPLAQEIAQDTAHVVLICGRYEGVDERVADALITDEISIGDYVLSGGEPAATVVIDAVVQIVARRAGQRDFGSVLNPSRKVCWTTRNTRGRLSSGE